MAIIYKFITKSDAKEFNDSDRSFVAWASRSSMDRQSEEIDASGWDVTNYEKNPVVPLFHDYSRFPIAKAEWVKKSPRVNPEGLLFKPTFAKTEIGQEAFYLYKEGFMSAFSVGFDPMEWMDSEGKTYTKAIDGDFGVWQKDYVQKKKKKPQCKYLKQELLEISGVLVPAHPDALIEARGFVKSPELIKYLEDMIEESETIDYKQKYYDSLIIIADQAKTLLKHYIVGSNELLHNHNTETSTDDNIDLDDLVGSCGDALGDAGDISALIGIEILGETGDDAEEFNLEDY